MTRMLIAKAALCVAALGTAMPPHAIAVEPNGLINDSRAAAPQIKDVELDAAGTLRGKVLSRNNLAGPSVIRVERTDGAAADATCDAEGCFAIHGLKGGVYQLRTPQHTEIVRLWSSHTAPPAATQHMVITPGTVTVRGQHHVGDIFRSDGFIVAAIIAAAIAIPVVVHNSRDRASDRDDDSSS